MLVASCLFKEDGTLLESKIPNIVVGDKESVKLEVSFYEDYDNLKILDLSNYVVEAIFERPDGKVSPALLLGIDLNNFNKKYLIFGGWLTEVAGISKITVRIKKSGTVKATGFLTFTIHDGNVPADVVITEPQFEALENAINAEEQARIADFGKAQADREAGDHQLDAKIDEVDERLQGNIDYETYSRESQDKILSDRIDRHEEEVRLIEQEVEGNFNVVHEILDTKLNKIFTDVATASGIALTDYLVINAGTKAYRITVEQLRDIISEKTNYFKGQYSSLEHLNSQVFSDGLSGGDYAYVDTEFTNDDGSKYYQFVMYVWDVEDGRWEETTSSQYLGVTTFQAFQESLLNGTFNVGAIEGNVDLIGGEPVLRSLKINDKVYEFPNVSLELSDEPVKDGYNLGSIKIDDNVWNIPNNMLKIKVSSERVEGATSLGSIKFGEDAYNIEKAFSPLVIGSKLLKGQALTKDIVENEHAVSDIYKFKRVLNGVDNGYYTVQFNKDVEGQFNYIFTNTSGSSQNAFNTATLNVVGDYWEVVEITTVEGYRFGSFSDTGKKIKALENKVHSLENSSGGSGKFTTIAEFTSVDAENNMILFDSLQFEADTLYFAIIENYVVPIYLDATFNSINADFSANFADTLYFMHLFYDGTNAPNKLKLTGQALDGSTFPYISYLSSAKICKL